jgi:hypothetical protein
MDTQPLVFISCGQSTDSEITLGHAVERVIRDGGAYEPYFAEAQNSLDGLSANILTRISDLAVIPCRQDVSPRPEFRGFRRNEPLRRETPSG